MRAKKICGRRLVDYDAVDAMRVTAAGEDASAPPDEVWSVEATIEGRVGRRREKGGGGSREGGGGRDEGGGGSREGGGGRDDRRLIDEC